MANIDRVKAGLGVALALLLALSMAIDAGAQTNENREKRAQTGFKFLSVSTHPRAAALGDAMTAMEGAAWMMFYNPAGMAHQTDRVSAVFSITNWIAGIDHSAAAISLQPFGSRFGVLGATLQAVNYGSLQGTVRADNEQGFLDSGRLKPTAFSLGVGYAKALTDRFSVGGHVKYVTQDLGSTALTGRISDGVFTAETFSDDKIGVVAFDFGMLYKTGFESLNFAVAARNFSQEIEYVEESFQLPLTLKIGVSMDVTDLMAGMSESHSILVAVEAENPRDFSENIRVGIEYGFLSALSLRAGYAFPMDEQGVSLGAGLAQSLGSLGLAADYAYTRFGVFSDVHRVAFQFSF